MYHLVLPPNLQSSGLFEKLEDKTYDEYVSVLGYDPCARLNG